MTKFEYFISNRLIYLYLISLHASVTYIWRLTLGINISNNSKTGRGGGEPMVK